MSDIVVEQIDDVLNISFPDEIKQYINEQKRLYLEHVIQYTIRRHRKIEQPEQNMEEFIMGIFNNILEKIKNKEPDQYINNKHYKDKRNETIWLLLCN
jgi:hypothetical protein